MLQIELEDYKKQYQSGEISKFDLQAYEIEVKNSLMAKESFELYVLLYELYLRLSF